jgi:hypothetical protein
MVDLAGLAAAVPADEVVTVEHGEPQQRMNPALAWIERFR